MGITVWVTKDFAHMSDVAAGIVIRKSIALLKRKKEITLGLATGNSPTGLYKHLAKAINEGRLDAGRIRSFNLDEYVGLPGDNIQQRVIHPESYAYFMIRELFGHLNKKFIETRVPYGSLIDLKMLIRTLREHKSDWEFKGTDIGKSIVIKPSPKSTYLAWIRKEILEGYAGKIKAAGGIDLQIIGVGGRGHVAFHESGIPFKGSSMLLVKLDDNTTFNAVTDKHFKAKADSPQYAISMGVELIYKAKTVVLVANGARKTEAITRSLLGNMTPEIPISYGQAYSQKGGELIYVLDHIAAQGLLENTSALKSRGVVLKNIA